MTNIKQNIIAAKEVILLDSTVRSNYRRSTGNCFGTLVIRIVYINDFAFADDNTIIYLENNDELETIRIINNKLD